MPFDVFGFQGSSIFTLTRRYRTDRFCIVHVIDATSYLTL